MPLARSITLAVALAALTGPAVANDSTGFVGTTGLELTATADIRMESEDLRIGLDEITVEYVFRNVTDRAVETTVVFPLPDIDQSLASSEANWDFPVDKPDFLGFRVWIDGKPVSHQLERKAFHKGKDVTAEVEAAGGFELTPWVAGGYDEAVRKHPPKGLARLRQLGLIQPSEDENTPQWTLRSRYYWTQTFPANAETRVRHVYRPFVGNALIGKPAEIDATKAVGRYWGSGGKDDRYCLDDGTRRGLRAMGTRTGKDGATFSAAEVEYIVTTARNWRGPIGSFRLTLDKGAPENVLSMCWDGLRKTGPTTFEATAKDFVPTRDIRLLVVVPPRRAGTR
jgi:hypothetical protein